LAFLALSDLMPELQKPAHERFAVLYASGWTKAAAWMEATGEADRKRATEEGCRVSKRADVAARLSELQRDAARDAAMDRRELLDYLAGAIRLPVGALDETSPLVEQITPTEHGAKLRAVSKLGACALLARLCGWEKPLEHSVSVTGSKEIDEALAALLSKK